MINRQRERVGLRPPLRLLALAAILVASATVHGQRTRVHYFQRADHPPGSVSRGQLLRDPALRGYVQPVEVLVPEGADVSLQIDGAFSDGKQDRLVAGMQVGYIYQLKITNIPNLYGREVYPTIEVINRLYPPEGKALRFPVPIQFTQDEIELALSGRFVTRVVYLEDPDTALPIKDTPGIQRYFETAANEDPLQAADRFGRPMLIMRMGSRVPDFEEARVALGFSSGPTRIYDEPELEPSADEVDAARAIDRQGYNVPRVMLPPTHGRNTAPLAEPRAQ